MNASQKSEYSRWVGAGLILGAAVGASIDVITGFSGVSSAVGAGLGIVFGSMAGHWRIARSGAGKAKNA